MRSLSLFVFLFVGLCNSAPTSTSFGEVVQETLDDVGNLFKAKAAVVKYTGEAVNEAAGAALKASSDYVSEIDPVEVTHSLEDSVLKGQETVVRGVFDAKRGAIKTLQEAKVWPAVKATVDRANEALDDINTRVRTLVENGRPAVVKEFISESVDRTSDRLSAALEDARNGIIAAKDSLVRTAQDFDSQRTLDTSAKTVGGAITENLETVEEFLLRIGVFESIDDMARSLAKIPESINKMLRAQEEAEEEEEEFEEFDLERALEEELEEEEEEAVEPMVDVQVTLTGDVKVDNSEKLEADIAKAVESHIEEKIEEEENEVLEA